MAEKQVILREMDMNQDEPGRRSGRRLFESAYTKSPYRFTIIGYPDIYNELQQDDIETYYRERYAPNNTFFVVVGDIKTDEVLAQIKQAYSGAKAKAMPPEVLPEEPRQTAAREVVVELKDTPSNTVPNTTGLPPGFPRPGASKVFENDKVRVWNYTWLPGKPTSMHFHNTEVVVAYRGNGDVASTTPDGKTAVNHRNAGDIVFNLANRSHSEELVKGEQSGIMLELK